MTSCTASAIKSAKYCAKKLAADPEFYRKRAARYKGGRRNSHLKRAYGLSLESWTKLFVTQGECCGVCGRTTPGKAGWHTDHNHVTKAFRGVLCTKCNLGLGLFNDDADLLRAAVKYLLPRR
jgi:hypothetical protein